MSQQMHDLVRDPIWGFIFGASSIVIGILGLLAGIFALPDPGREICAAISIVVIAFAIIILYISIKNISK